MYSKSKFKILIVCIEKGKYMGVSMLAVNHPVYIYMIYNIICIMFITRHALDRRRLTCAAASADPLFTTRRSPAELSRACGVLFRWRRSATRAVYRV